MALDPSISLQVRAPQFDNQLQQYGQMMQLESARNQNALAQYSLSKARREDDDNNALRAALQGADISTPAGLAQARNAMLKIGNVKGAMEIDKASLEAQKTRGDIGKTNIQTQLETAKYLRDSLVGVNDQQTYDAWRQNGASLGANVAINAPAQFSPYWKQSNIYNADKWLEANKPVVNTIDNGRTIDTRLLNTMTGEIRPVSSVNRLATPDAILSDARQRSEGAANRGVTVQGQNLTDARARERLAFDTDPVRQGAIAAAREGGQVRGKITTETALALPGAIEKANTAVRLIDELIGTATIEDGKLVPSARGVKVKQPHPGFQSAVGAALVPGLRFVEGSDTAGFINRLEQVKGTAFLDAYESLKKGGAISEIEGAKGTAAINRMSKATSEKEFVSASREFQRVVRTGVENARKMAAGGVAPSAASGRVIDFNDLN